MALPKSKAAKGGRPKILIGYLDWYSPRQAYMMGYNKGLRHGKQTAE